MAGALSLGLAVALGTLASPAHADEAPTSAQSPGVVGRFGATLAYRDLYGVPAYGGGLALAVGFERHGIPVLFRLRVVDARTQAGLVLVEVAGDLAAEVALGQGWHLGLGGGLSSEVVPRVTDDHTYWALVPKAFAQLILDLGARPNV